MEDALSEEAILGDEAKRFLSGDLGKHMLDFASKEVEDAIIELEDTDPSDQKKMWEIKNRIWRAKNFGGWLYELVQRGDEALRVYQQQKQ